MKRFLMLVVVLSCMSVACRTAPAPVKPAPVEEAPKATVTPASWREPPITSASYRRAWNEAAGELFDLQWEADRGESGAIDIAAGDLAIPASQRGRFGQPETGPIVASMELDRAVTLVGERLEEKRRAAVSDALAEQVEAHANFDLAALPKPEREAAQILAEAASLVDDLYLMQNHPSAIDFERELIRDGDVDSIRFFRRAGGPASPRCGDALYASALRRFPDRMPAAAMWPDGMNEKLLEEIVTRGGANSQNPFLSPFTAVKRSEAGDLIWMPYGAYPPFAGTLRGVARRLEEAGAVDGADPAFKALVERIAATLSSSDAWPYGDLLEAWAGYAGPLEVVAGPFGIGRDPYRTKGFYEFILAVPNERAGALVAKARPLLVEFEAAIAQVSGGTYAARNIEGARPVRAVDVLVATGFAAGDEGPALEIAPSAGNGAAAKRLVAVNHHEAMLPVIRQAGQAALVPAIAAQVDAWGMATYTILAALVRDLGPQADQPISAGLTAERALGRQFAPLFAAKTDAQAMRAAGLLTAKGIISEEELRRIVAAYLATLVQRMRRGNDPVLAAAAATELSYLAWHGALKEQGTRLAVVADRFPAVIEAMQGDLVRAMAAGNTDAAAQLIVSYPAKMPDNAAVALAALEGGVVPRGAAVSYHLARANP